MANAIYFEFNNHNVPAKKTYIWQKKALKDSEFADNISIHLMKCDCCYTVYLPIHYEYKYREWLDNYGLVPKETKYINNRHNEDKNWIYFDSEQKKFTALLNELMSSEQNTTELLNRDWTVKYHVATEPDELFAFTKDVHRVSDVYKKVLELFISAIEIYKDWLPQFSNWGISNNLVYAKKLQMPKQMSLNNGLKELRMFDICINGKKEVACVVY